MFQIIAAETLKTVELVEDYGEAESICIVLEHMGKHCAQLMFDDATIDTDDVKYREIERLSSFPVSL